MRSRRSSTIVVQQEPTQHQRLYSFSLYASDQIDQMWDVVQLIIDIESAEEVDLVLLEEAVLNAEVVLELLQRSLEDLIVSTQREKK